MTLRLPVRFQNRWTYGLAAWLSAVLVVNLLPYIVELITGEFGNTYGINDYWAMEITPSLALGALVPTVLAVLAFPVEPRSARDLAFAGVIVVLVSFVPIGVAAGMVMSGFPMSVETPWDVVTGLVTIVVMIFWTLVGGTFFTLGLPFWIAVGVSLLFVSDDEYGDAALDDFVRAALAKTERKP